MNIGFTIQATGSSAKKAGNKRDYYYAATRARAMITKLLAEEEYAKLMKMDINEVLRFLEEGEYKKEIDAIGIKAAKIEILERVLNENFANSINRLLHFTPASSPIWAYIMRYDIANIKTILRSKIGKGKKEEVWQKLIPLGSFSKEQLKSFVDLETKAQVIEGLRRTPYYKVLKECENKPQEELEDALDRFYFAIILKRASGELFEKFVKMEIDSRNLLALLRLKRAKVQNIERFFIKGGRISIEKLLELGRLDEFEIINAVRGQSFWKYVPANTKELDKIEAGLRRYLLLYGWSMKSDYSPTSNALLGYIVGKEREVANIRILARAKTTKNPEDALDIRSKLYVK